MTNLELAALGLPESLLRTGNPQLIQAVVGTVVHESQMNKLLRSEMYNLKKDRDRLEASIKSNEKANQDTIKAKVEEEKAKWKRKVIRLKHLIRQARIKQRADRQSFSHLLSVIQQLRNEKHKLVEESTKNSEFYQRRLQLLGTQMEEMKKLQLSKVKVATEHREELTRQVKAKDDALAEFKLENDEKIRRIKQLEEELRCHKQGYQGGENVRLKQNELDQVQNELKMVTEKFDCEVSRRQQIKQQMKLMEDKLAKIEGEKDKLRQELETGKAKFSKELDSQKKIVKQLTEDLLKQRKEHHHHHQRKNSSEQEQREQQVLSSPTGASDFSRVMEEKKDLERRLEKEQNERKLQVDQLNKELIRKRSFYEKEIERLRRMKSDNDRLTKEYMALSNLVYTRRSSPSNIENSEISVVSDLEHKVANEMVQRKQVEDKYNSLKQRFLKTNEDLQLLLKKNKNTQQHPGSINQSQEQIATNSNNLPNNCNVQLPKPSKSSQTSLDGAQTNEKLWLKNLELNDRVKEVGLTFSFIINKLSEP